MTSPEEEVYKLLSVQIRSRREMAGLTIEQLAEKAGIGAGFLGLIETNNRKPSLMTVAKLAGALDLPLESLFRGASEPHHDPNYRIVRQFASLIHDKTPEQKATIIETLKALAKNLGKPRRAARSKQ